MKKQVKEEPTSPGGGFFATVTAVLLAFLGVRKKSRYEKGAAQLNPVPAVFVGLLGAMMSMVFLAMLVNFIVAQ